MFLGLIISASVALDNGLGQTPGLGWNSDYCAGCHAQLGRDENINGFQNEAFIKHITDYMHSAQQPTADGKTLQMLGYEYINMDASWNLPTRDSKGDLQPNPALWPSGMDNTISYVHSKGLKFGLYGDRGTKDCASNPGAQGHEVQDANYFGKHKVDWYKEDNCNSQGGNDEAFVQYGKMRDALNATGYPVWFALCGWSTDFSSDPRGNNMIGNSARVGPDTGTGWTAVIINIQAGLETAKYSGPFKSGGFWNDGSLMLTPGMGHGAENLMSNDRHRTQWSSWAVLGMNILLVGNYSALPSYVMETWTNVEVLAINQDVAGLPAVDLSKIVAQQAVAAAANDTSPEYEAAKVQECGGEPTLQQWDIGVVEPGYISNSASKQCLNVEGCGSSIIYDGCTTGAEPTCGGGHQGFHPNEQFTLQANGQITSALRGNSCMTAGSDGVVKLAKCSVAVTSSQKWTYDKATKELTTGGDGGLCLTASSSRPGPPSGGGGANIAIGRPLHGGDAAILFLNDAANTTNATTFTCGAACLSAVGITSGNVAVRDLWTHSTYLCSVSATEGFNATVAGGGASRVFRVSPSA